LNKIEADLVAKTILIDSQKYGIYA
jgi:hypothetical protein